MTSLADTPPTVQTTSNTAVTLFEHVVSDIARRGVGADPAARLAAVGTAIRDTRWRSYQAGRARMCGLTGVYWAWLSPTTGWTFVGIPPVPIMWQSAEDAFADVAVWDTMLDDPAVRARVAATTDAGTAALGETFRGVRLLAMTGIMRSRFVWSSGQGQRLADTPFWFGGDRDG